MITAKEALNILKENTTVLGKDNVPLSLSLNRVLASDILALNNFPPFNKSAVDGYACIKSNIPGTLTQKDIIKAGDNKDLTVNNGECIKIMTGGIVPNGADYIVMFEDTVKDESGNIKIKKEVSENNNICFEGEDKKSGDLLLKKGCLLKEKHIGVLASAGIHTVEVYKQPLVSVFSTGSELVEPEDEIEKGQIRNANGPQIIALLQGMGISGLYGGITDDDDAIMEIEIARSLEHFNGIILSGGVSAGDYDLVPSILKKMGFQIQFHKINLKPGKPVLFATKGDRFCFGLPGNPVSSYVQFEILVKPFLYGIMGYDYHPLILKLPVAEDISRKKSDTESYIPIDLNEDGNVIKIPYNGSGDIFAFSSAYGLIHIPKGVDTIKKGEAGIIRPF